MTHFKYHGLKWHSSYPNQPAPNVNTESAFRNFPFSSTNRSILNFSGSGWVSVTCGSLLRNMLIQLMQNVLSCDVKTKTHSHSHSHTHTTHTHTTLTLSHNLSFTLSPLPLYNTWVHMSSIEVSIDHSILWQVVSLECSVFSGTLVRESDAGETCMSLELMKKRLHKP